MRLQRLSGTLNVLTATHESSYGRQHSAGPDQVVSTERHMNLLSQLGHEYL